MKRLFFFTLWCVYVLSVHPVNADESVKIAVVFSHAKTAVQAYVAAEDIRGAELAVDAINAQGGLLGRPVEIVETRTSNALQAKTAVAELVQQGNILAVIGSNTSDTSLAVAPDLQEAGIPMISPISTNPRVTVVGDYIFRACFIDPFQGSVMAQFALQDLQATTAVIIKKTNSRFSVGLAEYFRETFSQQGTVLWEGKYLAEDVDFTRILTQVKELQPDVVFLPGHSTDSGLALKQAHAMGLNTTFLGGDGWGKGVLNVAEAEAAEGHYFSNHWHIDVQTPLNRQFVAAYGRKYGETLIAASAPLAYDAMLLLANAVQRAQSFERAAIRDALAATKDLQGITGTYRFDQHGDPIDKQAVILKYEQGEITFVTTFMP